MRDYIPLNRIETATLLCVVFCLGLGAGIFIGALPHPAIEQRTIATVLVIVGLVAFVVLSVHRLNKEWKIRTSSFGSRQV